MAERFKAHAWKACVLTRYRGFARHTPGVRRMPDESKADARQIQFINKIMEIYYVYVLQSEKDKNLYVGMTADIERRRSEHFRGKVISTKNRLPLRMLFYEVYFTKIEAMRREKYLKSSDGRKDIKKRITESMLS